LATLGSGLVLRSLVTGVPARILLDPLSANAHESDDGEAKVLILSNSSQGDPLNCHVPGACAPEHTDIVRPAGWEPQSVEVNGKAHFAAPIWQDYEELSQTLFFHHKSGTPVHGDMDRVHRMLDRTDNNDMLVSMLSARLAKQHPDAYVQARPLSVGASRASELLTAGGVTLSNAAPRAIRQALLGIDSPVAEPWVRQLRDDTLVELHEIYRRRGTPAQRGLLDRWVSARDSVRNLGNTPEYTEVLDLITDDGSSSQVIAAAVLAAIKIAPVITIRLDFGGDNHGDPGWEDETTRHAEGIAQLNDLHHKLIELNAADHTLVGILNVFGRTFTQNEGRDHNMHHNVMMLHGPGIAGGVIGGLEKHDQDYGAMSIDPNSGEGVANGGGGIDIDDTLASAGKTMGHALGITEEDLDLMLEPGQVVHSAFA